MTHKKIGSNGTNLHERKSCNFFFTNLIKVGEGTTFYNAKGKDKNLANQRIE